MMRPLLVASLLPFVFASCATRDVEDTSGGALDGAGGDAGDPSGAGGAGGATAGGGQAGSAQVAGSSGAGHAGEAGAAGSEAGHAGQSLAGAAGQGPAGQAGAQPFGGGGGAAGTGTGGMQPFGGGGGSPSGGTAGLSGKGGTAGQGASGGTAGVSGQGGTGGSGAAGSGAGGTAGSGAGGQGGQTGALCTYSGTGLDDPCYTCWNQAQTGNCAKQHDDCAGNAECRALMVCWDQCISDDEKCSKKCSADHPDGASAFQLFQSCLCGFACENECQDQCSGISSLNRCKHDVCTSGFDLDPDCSPCAKEVCDEDQTCCDFGWDNSCVSKAEAMCGCPAPGTCLHSECATGAPLDPACSPCAKAVCDEYPLCCDTFGKWDLACANAVASLCSP